MIIRAIRRIELGRKRADVDDVNIEFLDISSVSPVTIYLQPVRIDIAVSRAVGNNLERAGHTRIQVGAIQIAIIAVDHLFRGIVNCCDYFDEIIPESPIITYLTDNFLPIKTGIVASAMVDNIQALSNLGAIPIIDRLK